MRALVASLVLLALLAGCFGKSAPPTATTTAAAPPTTAASMHGLRSNDTVNGLPAAFGGGFDVVTHGTGFRGGQPSLGITAKGTLFTDVFVQDPVASALNTLGYGGVIRSTDHGRTWTLVQDPTHNPGTVDPMLWVDQDTGRIFNHQSQAGCDWLSYSDDDGATWTPNPVACGTPFTDHQKIGSGPYAAASPLAAAKGVYPNLVTLCYNKVGGTFCAVSVDGGVHFTADALVDANAANAAVATDRSCGGINGHQKTAPDGTIYVPYGYNCGVAFVGVSTDSGLTWTPRRLGLPEQDIDPSVAVTPDGTAYYLFRSDDQKMYLLRSHDRFQTHDGPFLVSPPDVNGTALNAIVAGSDGRIAFAFLGHQGDLAHPGKVRDPDGVDERTRWNLYVGMSLDGESKDPYFLVRQATPDSDPVQVGCIGIVRQPCTHINLMYFLDAQKDADGRAWFSFADGCTSEACKSPNSTQANSNDQMVSVAAIVGPSLLADKGRLGPV